MNYEIIDSFKQAMLDVGITPPDEIIPDGHLHRFKIDGKLNGAYVLHLDGRAAGYFQDFKQGIKETWKAEGYTKRLTDAERRAFADQRRIDEAKRKAAEAAKHTIAANKAKYIWQNAKPATDHPYLTRKHIKPYGARLGRDNTLILPLLDERLELVNLQFIQEDGTKRFLTGGRKRGYFWWIGKPSDRVLICEGFATGASIYETTNEQCFVAFDAGNLLPVAQVLRAKKPNSEIIVMADNDISGVGQKKAREAALALPLGVNIWCALLRAQILTTT